MLLVVRHINLNIYILKKEMIIYRITMRINQ